LDACALFGRVCVCCSAPRLLPRSAMCRALCSTCALSRPLRPSWPSRYGHSSSSTQQADRDAPEGTEQQRNDKREGRDAPVTAVRPAVAKRHRRPPFSAPSQTNAAYANASADALDRECTRGSRFMRNAATHRGGARAFAASDRVVGALMANARDRPDAALHLLSSGLLAK